MLLSNSSRNRNLKNEVHQQKAEKYIKHSFSNGLKNRSSEQINTYNNSLKSDTRDNFIFTNEFKEDFDKQPITNFNQNDSEINELFNETDESNEKELEECREFQENFFEQMFDILSDEKLSPQEEIQLLLKLYFTLQKFYQCKFSYFKMLKEEFKKYLIQYYNKYALQLKKYNVLKGKCDNNLLKEELVKTHNSLLLYDKETKIDERKLFNLISKNEKKLSTNEEMEKDLLIKVSENVMNNKKLFFKLKEKDRRSLEQIINKKKGVLTLFNENNYPSENGKISSHLDTENKIEIALSEKALNDSIDLALKKQLIDHSSKKFTPNIPFVKISKGVYVFGTMRINIILDKNSIKVKYGNGFITLNQFIELNAYMEETKLKNKQHK